MIQIRPKRTDRSSFHHSPRAETETPIPSHRHTLYTQARRLAVQFVSLHNQNASRNAFPKGLFQHILQHS